MQVQKVNSEELEAAIANRDKAILVDFFGALPVCVASGKNSRTNSAAAQTGCSKRRKLTLPPSTPTNHQKNTSKQTATWCGPCLLLAQELEKVAADMGDSVDILKLDVDENPDLASALQVCVVVIIEGGGGDAVVERG